jgi:hypothetical protein
MQSEFATLAVWLHMLCYVPARQLRVITAAGGRSLLLVRELISRWSSSPSFQSNNTCNVDVSADFCFPSNASGTRCLLSFVPS